MTEQEKLIGEHPLPSHILGEWLAYTDHPTTVSKKHRKLEENNGLRQKAIDKIAGWIIEHHILDSKMDSLKRKSQILQKHEFDKFVDSQHLLPITDKTRKGNIAEIILVEYLQESTGLSPIIHKLRYNPNVEQSMKGDDVLLLNPDNVFKKIIYGESKYRSTPSKKVIRGAVSNLEGNKRFPVSIGFVENILREQGNVALADKLMDLQGILKDGTVNIHNVGFLLSSRTTSAQVERHLNTTNPNLVFISLGLNNPTEIVEKSFELANKRLLNIKQDGTN
jgi:hypothetical protein